MAAIQVNWVRDWKFKSFSTQVKKDAFRAMAVESIDGQIANLNNNGARISPVYRLRWTRERSGSRRPFLLCYITPAAEFIPGQENSKPGGGGSTVSPQPPPMP